MKLSRRTGNRTEQDRRAWAFVVLLLGTVAISSGWARPARAEETSFFVVADLPYKPEAETEYERERCKLDLYLPEGREDFATIVWFHGGGLKNGHKDGNIAVGLADRFASEGIAVASVNYRLSPRVTYPAYIEDAAAAVAYVSREIGSYGGSSQQVFVSGHSAGGYLTLMLGLDERYLQAHGLRSDALAGCIPVAGQTITHSTVREERGVSRTQPIIDEAAPCYYVRAEAPPFLCIVGSDDLPARAEENRYFVAAMTAAEHPIIKYLEVAGRTHGSVANRMHEPDDVVAHAIQRFVREVGSRRQ